MDPWQVDAGGTWQREVVVPSGRVVAVVSKRPEAAGYQAAITVIGAADGRAQPLLCNMVGLTTLREAQTHCDALLTAFANAA